MSPENKARKLAARWADIAVENFACACEALGTADLVAIVMVPNSTGISFQRRADVISAPIDIFIPDAFEFRAHENGFYLWILGDEHSAVFTVRRRSFVALSNDLRSCWRAA